MQFQKHSCKPSGMSSSKTLDLKSFRMSIYRKTARGADPFAALANQAARVRPGTIIALAGAHRPTLYSPQMGNGRSVSPVGTYTPRRILSLNGRVDGAAKKER